MGRFGIFVIGAVVGAVASYILTSKKYEKKINELDKCIDTMYEAATKKEEKKESESEEAKETENKETSADDIDDSEFNEDGSFKELTYDELKAGGFKFAEKKDPRDKEYEKIAKTYSSDEPFVISEDEFCERNHYDKKYVIFNEDTHEAYVNSTGELIDADAELGDYLGLMDVDNTSGDGYIYIRNDRYSTDYAVDLSFTPGADHTGN